MTIEEIAILLYRAFSKASFIKFQTPFTPWDDLALANKAVWISVANTAHRSLIHP